MDTKTEKLYDDIYTKTSMLVPEAHGLAEAITAYGQELKKEIKEELAGKAAEEEGPRYYRSKLGRNPPWVIWEFPASVCHYDGRTTPSIFPETSDELVSMSQAEGRLWIMSRINDRLNRQLADANKLIGEIEDRFSPYPGSYRGTCEAIAKYRRGYPESE